MRACIRWFRVAPPPATICSASGAKKFRTGSKVHGYHALSLTRQLLAWCHPPCRHLAEPRNFAASDLCGSDLRGRVQFCRVSDNGW